MNKDQLKILASILFYLVATFFLHPIVGNLVGMFILVPIVVSAWVYGKKGGLITGIVLAVLNYMLLRTLNILVTRDLIQIMMGSVAGIIIGFSFGFTRDKLSELENLRNQLIGLKLGVERSKDVIFITNKNGIITYANTAFTKTYGYTSDEWKGKTPRLIKSGKQTTQFYENFWGKIKSGQTIELSIINKTKDGRFISMEASVNPIISESQGILGFLAIQRDVTEKKRLDESLLSRSGELERLNSLMVDRELKMIELKENLKNKIH